MLKLKDIEKWMENSVVDEIIIFALFIASLELIAQNNLKLDTDYSYKFVIGIIFYIAIGCILHYAYDKFPLSKFNITWSSITIIVSVVLGYYLYEEEATTKTFLAVIFALLAIHFVNN